MVDQEAPNRSCPLKAFSVGPFPRRKEASVLEPGGPLIDVGIEHGELRCSGEKCMWWMASKRHDKPGECAVVVMARNSRSS